MLTSLSENIRKAYHLLMSIYEQLFFLKVPMTGLYPSTFADPRFSKRRFSFGNAQI